MTMATQDPIHPAYDALGRVERAQNAIRKVLIEIEDEVSSGTAEAFARAAKIAMEELAAKANTLDWEIDAHEASRAGST